MPAATLFRGGRASETRSATDSPSRDPTLTSCTIDLARSLRALVRLFKETRKDRARRGARGACWAVFDVAALLEAGEAAAAAAARGTELADDVG